MGNIFGDMKPVVPANKGINMGERIPSTTPSGKNVDADLVNMIGVEPKPKKIEGRLSKTQWKAAELMWRECRSFSEISRHYGISVSAISRMAKRAKWIERVGQSEAIVVRQQQQLESQASIVARVTQQLSRLDDSDKAALIEAVRADHLKIGRELIEMGRIALSRCPIEKPADALRLIELGLKTEAEAIADNGGSAASLTMTLKEGLQKFGVKSPAPKVTVTDATKDEQ